jgi:hypothetical protein
MGNCRAPPGAVAQRVTSERGVAARAPIARRGPDRAGARHRGAGARPAAPGTIVSHGLWHGARAPSPLLACTARPVRAAGRGLSGNGASLRVRIPGVPVPQHPVSSGSPLLGYRSHTHLGVRRTRGRGHPSSARRSPPFDVRGSPRLGYRLSLGALIRAFPAAPSHPRISRHSAVSVRRSAPAYRCWSLITGRWSLAKRRVPSAERREL